MATYNKMKDKVFQINPDAYYFLEKLDKLMEIDYESSVTLVEGMTPDEEKMEWIRYLMNNEGMDYDQAEKEAEVRREYYNHIIDKILNKEKVILQ